MWLFLWKDWHTWTFCHVALPDWKRDLEEKSFTIWWNLLFCFSPWSIAWDGYVFFSVLVGYFIFLLVMSDDEHLVLLSLLVSYEKSKTEEILITNISIWFASITYQQTRLYHYQFRIEIVVLNLIDAIMILGSRGGSWGLWFGIHQLIVTACIVLFGICTSVWIPSFMLI